MNNDLSKLALTVRLELEKAVKDDKYCLSTEPFDLKPFPHGCCKLSSLILGLFMKNDFNLNGVEYVFGIHNEMGSHGWIEYNSIIYDITIDQFDTKFKNHPILVINKALSDFHNSYKLQQRFGVVLSKPHKGYTIYETIKEQVLSKISK